MALAALGAGCRGDDKRVPTVIIIDTLPPTSGSATPHLRFRGDSIAVSTAGQPISPVIVEVVDSAGNLLGHRTWMISIALVPHAEISVVRGTVNRPTVNGSATFDDLVIDRSGMGVQLTASMTGAAVVSSRAFAVRNGPAAKLTFRPHPGNGVYGGLRNTVVIRPALQVEIRDAFDNLVRDAMDSVTLVIDTNPVGGTMSGGTTVRSVEGVATFDDIVFDRSAGYMISATANGLQRTATTRLWVLQWQPTAHRVRFVSEPRRSVAGAWLTPFSRVEVIDSAGRLVTHVNLAVTVRLAPNPAGGVIRGYPTAVSGNPGHDPVMPGIAKIDYITIDKPGTGYRLIANVPGLLPDTTEPFDVIPALDLRPAGALAIDGNTTCGLTSSGAAHCWGDNTLGKLGDGRPLFATRPVSVAGGHQFTDVVSGSSFSCGLSIDGLAWCWGANDGGRLGDGTLLDRPRPTPVAGGHRFTKISASYDNVCGLDQSGSAWCWGMDQRAPLPLPAGSGLKDINVAWSVCVLTAAGHVRCLRGAGFLEPINGAGDSVFVSLAGEARRTCAVRTNGEAWCWGDLAHFDSYDEAPIVARNEGGSRAFTQISSSTTHTCGLTANREAWCWGYNSIPYTGGTQQGFLGHDGSTGIGVVAGGHRFVSIAVGYGFSCGIDEAGDLWCWGANRGGIFGSDLDAWSASPVRISGPPSLARLGKMGSAMCGLTAAGAAWCWGGNWFGELGNSGETMRTEPVAVAGGRQFAALSSGSVHACGITNTGATYCWGGLSGYRGAPVTSTPMELENGNHSTAVHAFVEIAAGASHNCGLAASLQAYCWGEGFWYLPLMAEGNVPFSTISAGESHTCGIAATGEAWCWGKNTAGQLGNGGQGNSYRPVAVSGGLRFALISAGGNTTCGITHDGEAWCWGDNGAGQLGDGSTGASSVPVRVQGGHTFVGISAGGNHSCALTSTGAAWCWGGNMNGQLGNGATVRSSIPVAVNGGLSFESITAGHDRGNGIHTCGVTSSGAYCWGSNAYGELGDGTTTARTSPVAVSGALSFPNAMAARSVMRARQDRVIAQARARVTAQLRSLER